ncbi:MAG TPA: alpha-amylase family glycosyl hydrolase, partial [Myxococcales bacterium]|nr:alpha-amylase family glycosyl hydrolase [Myxococcales bacterium]
MPWKPWLGAVPGDGATHFRVWAPKAPSLSVKLAGGPSLPLYRDPDGYFTGRAEGVRAGARYFYRFADGRERPDPASLLQPEGVHGPSEVVDLAAIAPQSLRARVPLERLIFCEIHLGTYTPEGTADAAARHLAELADALYTAVEVMPVAAFPGARNWGYDGVSLFAAHAAYGGPAGLARLVDAAHAQGLSAFLDVVYNHLGPEGNYLGEYGPYFTSKHKTPWGDALDFSLPAVRRYFVENALRWVSRAGGGFDGLRLDAVHGILDDSPTHILQEIADAVHAEGGLVIAESDLNDVKLIEEYRLDGSWADDLHHALHVALTGESQGYYADFQDPMPQMATAIERGWFYEGQHKPSFGRKHGTPAAHLPARHFVVCAQNHDQIGNRARGERLVELAGTDAARG